MNEIAKQIIDSALHDAMPNAAVRKALEKIDFGSGKLVVVAAGKAAWEMGKAASEALSGKFDAGIVITKYEHSHGDIAGMEIHEAGHPVPDANSYSSTARALELVRDLRPEDNVLFLLSGGGSALFEKPLISEEEMAGITKQLLASGADITEMNTIRKRLSSVKGGRFALACMPAHVYTVVLSDIIGDPLDMIASGPAYPDTSTCEQAEAIIKKYGIQLSNESAELMKKETPKSLDNVTTFVTGSVRQLCASASAKAKELGYEPVFLTSSLSCEAREAGAFLGAIAADNCGKGRKLAFLAGGETIVHLKGKGLGGRNQEIALAAAPFIAGLEGVSVFSFGSDGTDGPTDAAGGYVDGRTMNSLKAAGVDFEAVMADNDAYHALKAVDGLIMTGPTGTNVNDLAVVLIDG